MSSNGTRRKADAPREIGMGAFDLTLVERAEYARRHAEQLTTLLDSPVIKEVSYRYWRAYAFVRSHFYPDGQLVSILMTQAINPPPGDNAQGFRVTFQVTGSFDYGPMAVTPLSLRGDYDVLDAIAFTRLDTVDPATVEWRDITRYRELITVESALASAIARQARGTND